MKKEPTGVVKSTLIGSFFCFACSDWIFLFEVHILLVFATERYHRTAYLSFL